MEALTNLPVNSQDCQDVFAIQGPQAGMELSMISCLHELRTVDDTLMDRLLGKPIGMFAQAGEIC